MVRKLWLIFAQSTTITLAAVFVISLLKPDLLPFRNRVISLTEASRSDAITLAGANFPPTTSGYAEAARKAIPSIVNIFTSKEVKTPSHLFLNEPVFRQYFFGDRSENGAPKQRSLGSGVIVSAQG